MHDQATSSLWPSSTDSRATQSPLRGRIYLWRWLKLCQNETSHMRERGRALGAGTDKQTNIHVFELPREHLKIWSFPFDDYNSPVIKHYAILTVIAIWKVKIALQFFKSSLLMICVLYMYCICARTLIIICRTIRHRISLLLPFLIAGHLLTTTTDYWRVKNIYNIDCSVWDKHVGNRCLCGK